MFIECKLCDIKKNCMVFLRFGFLNIILMGYFLKCYLFKGFFMGCLGFMLYYRGEW